MTVSRALSGSKPVSDRTREAVLKAVRLLRYAPDPAARSLASARAERFVLLRATPRASSFHEMLLGLLEESSRLGIQLLLERAVPRGCSLRARQLLDAGVTGVILTPPLGDSSAVLQELEQAAVPVVAIGVGRPRDDLMCVCIDDFAAARQMTAYLLALGHRRIGFIKGPADQTAADQRWRGFLAACREASIEPNAAHVHQGFFSYRSGLDAARALLSHSQLPTAVFASNDDMAAALITEAQRRGLLVPRDLTVVGFDDSPIACNIWPELTTVHQPIREMAREAVRMLVEATPSQRAPCRSAPRRKLLEHALVSRDSASVPRAD